MTALYGYRLVVAPGGIWPQVQDGESIVRVPGHPLVHWLARWFLFDPFTEFREPKFRDVDPIIDHGSGTIFCSAAQEAEIRRQTAEQRQGAPRPFDLLYGAPVVMSPRGVVLTTNVTV